MKSEITARLDGFVRRQIDMSGLRAASVCVVIVTGETGPAILLTRRPAKMGRHAGQFALPGGKVDPGETAEAAALRELDEELGLDLPPSAVLGRLDDYPTRSGFCMQPFVLWGGTDPVLTPAPGEVAQIFRIPFKELESEAIPLLQPGEDLDRPILYSDFPSVGTTMFSPTAAIIYQFRELCLRGLATRVAHFDQPRFAWK